MLRSTTTVRYAAIASIGTALLLGLSVAAVDSNQSGQALEIAPPVLNLTTDPGKTVTARISLRDVSPTKVVVSNEINDFTASGEDGTPKILLKPTEEANPYSLRPWIQPLPRFTLNPQEINEIPVTIRVPSDAAPGGYYAVIRFTASPPDIEGTGVSLSPSLGTLVFLRVNGDAKESMAIEDFFVSKNQKRGSLFESKPVDFEVRLKNTGNLFQQPVGQIEVTDMFGKNVAAVNVNLARTNVLPGTVRKYVQSLDEGTIGKRALFGRYTAKLTMKYGSTEQSISQQATFYVLPWRLITLAIAFLIVLVIVIRIAMRRYNERIISRSRSRRRRR